MLMNFNVQYLTNEKGIKTAVQIPYKDWNNLIQEYSKLREILTLKKDLKQGFYDLIEVENGNSEYMTKLDESIKQMEKGQIELLSKEQQESLLSL